MSQEKVDRYKKEKANRKKTMKKEKIQYYIRRCVVAVLAVALVGWIGYSAFRVYEDSRPVETAEVNYNAITDYETSLNTGECSGADERIYIIVEDKRRRESPAFFFCALYFGFLRKKGLKSPVKWFTMVSSGRKW